MIDFNFVILILILIDDVILRIDFDFVILNLIFILIVISLLIYFDFLKSLLYYYNSFVDVFSFCEGDCDVFFS
jgi:hypothetical protein